MRPYAELTKDIATFIEGARPVLDPGLQIEHEFGIRLARAHLISRRPRVFYHWRLTGHGIHWLDFQFLRILRDLAQRGYPVACLVTDRMTRMPHQMLRTQSELEAARTRVQEIVEAVLGRVAPSSFLFWLSEIRKDDRGLSAFALDGSGYDFDAREELLNLSPFAGAALELNNEFDLWLRWIAWTCKTEGGGIVFCRKSSAVYDFLELFGTVQVAIVRTREFMLGGRHGKKELPGAGLYLDPPEHSTIRDWVKEESDKETLISFLGHLRGPAGDETPMGAQGQACEGLRRLILDELAKINEVWFDVSGQVINRIVEVPIGKSSEISLPELQDEGLLESDFGTSSTRDEVFISYSHADSRWLQKLKLHLAPLVRDEKITVWEDTKIKVGAKWGEELVKAMSAAKVIVLLVTPNYLSSTFVRDFELPAFFRAADRWGVKILWIPVSFSSYDFTPIAEYQAALPPKKPLNRLSSAQQDGALVEVCHQIRELLN
jgi:hypothetical protein